MDNTRKMRQFYKDFIELYRSKPELWKVKSDEYKNRVLKARAYDVLAEKFKEIGEDVDKDFVKKKINSLRSSYRRELKKYNASLQSGEEYIPSLWHFKYLHFLRGQEEALDDDEQNQQQHLPWQERRRNVHQSEAENNKYDDRMLRQLKKKRKREKSSKTVMCPGNESDKHEKEYIDSLAETKVDFEANDLSNSESSYTEQAKISSPTCSKKRKRSPEPKPKLDGPLDKLLPANKDDSVFETFGENVARQVKEFAEDDAYQLMADIQLMLSKRKMDLLRKVRGGKSKINSEEEFTKNKWRRDESLEQNELLQLAFQQLKQSNDESEIMGRVWASEFKKLSPDQQVFAKKAIDDILFEGRMDTLHRHSVKINEESNEYCNNLTDGNDEKVLEFEYGVEETE